jgi:DNA replication protein DnaC
MLNHPTYDKLLQLRLTGMAKGLAEQAAIDLDHLGFAERLGLLVDREASERDGRALAMRLKRAQLKPSTAPEDLDTRHPRGLDVALYQRLLTGEWVRAKQNVLLTGPTGVGKTWLACALANQACRQGHSAPYVRLPRLLDELAAGRGDGQYRARMRQLARVSILVLDDWGLALLTDTGRRDLLELLDDRHDQSSTIVTSQLPVENWHDALGDPTLADAILDRLVHNAHHLKLHGESLRKGRERLTAKKLPE